MALRAWARVIFTAANSPATAARRGFTAGLDTATGRVTFTLSRAMDQTEGFVLASFVHGSVGTGSPVMGSQFQGTIEATVSSADTTVEVRTRAAATLTDPVVGTGFCVGVFDSIGLRV